MVKAIYCLELDGVEATRLLHLLEWVILDSEYLDAARAEEDEETEPERARERLLSVKDKLQQLLG